MTEAQFDRLLAVLVPFLVAITGLATAVTANFVNNRRNHLENVARLASLEEKVGKRE